MCYSGRCPFEDIDGECRGGNCECPKDDYNEEISEQPMILPVATTENLQARLDIALKMLERAVKDINEQDNKIALLEEEIWSLTHEVR